MPQLVGQKSNTYYLSVNDKVIIEKNDDLMKNMHCLEDTHF